ncbi:MAG: hypothetical protein L6N96_03835 [Candidatus Methylarchaceae archaeon HK02M2]|nr:hypothetical protein [Candidatus Methylarchaceae archaeon HK02M2]
MKIQPFNHHLNITVEAFINPSEDIDKVISTIRNLIKDTDSDFLLDNKTVTTSTKDERSLYYIYERIRAKQMLAVVRRLLFSRMNQDTTWLIFNKQAAFVGSVNVCEEESESPLGPIKIIIQSDHIHEFIEWLAPK